MEFSIYSVGSATYLESILNAVAMISGSGSIESLAKVGLLIGTLFLGFQAVFKNQAIPFQQVGVALILYMALYGPTGRAVVEDVYDGTVVVVDNVPIGPLFVGSVVSNIGYKLTREMEQAFSTPAMTTYGFADPLTTLMKVRGATRNVLAMPSVMGDTRAGGDFVRSWMTYIKECTLVGVGRNVAAYGALMRSNKPVDAMRFESQVYGTEIFEGNTGVGTYYTCSEAHTRLKALSASTQSGIMDDVAKLAFQKSGKTVTGDDVTTRVDDALRGLNLQVADARAFTMASVLLPIFERAPAQKALEDQQGAYAIMLAQAQAQQATQWASEGSMFTRYVRPFLTFFEGLIYAITPMMAFLLVMGTFGMNLITKYITMLCWMMLWQPMLAIVNLYTNWYTGTVMEGLLATTSSVTDGNALSFEMMKQMMPALDSAIGVAGLMASSVPVISMFLVTGSAVAFTSMAQRLGGSDQINEKIVSPDVVTPSAGLQTTPHATSDYDKGLRINGSENQRGTIDISQGLFNTMQSQRAQAEQSSKTFNKQLMSSFAKQFESAKTIGEQAEVGRAMQNAFGLSRNAEFNSGYQSAVNSGLSSTQVDAAIASTTLSANGALKAPMGGVGSASVGAEGSTSTSIQTSDSQKLESAVGRVKSSGLGETTRNAIDKTEGYKVAENFQNSERLGVSQSDQESLSRSAQKAISENKQYSETAAYQKSVGMSENMGVDSWAGRAIREGKADSLVNEAMNRYPQDFKEQHALNASMLDPERRDVGAALITLGKHNDLGVLARPPLNHDEYSNIRQLQPREFSDIQRPNSEGVERDTANAGHQVSSGDFAQRHSAGYANASGPAATKAVGDAWKSHDRTIEGSGQAYAQRAMHDERAAAEGRLRDKSRDVDNRGESLTNIAGSAIDRARDWAGLKPQFEAYKASAENLGLQGAQQDVYASAKLGHLDNAEVKQKWDGYVKEKRMDKELAAGMYENIVQAARSNNGNGALGDVMTLNRTDDIVDDVNLRGLQKDN